MAETTSKRNISLTGNIRFTGIQLKEPKQVAAGVIGVKEALKHSVKEMGIARSMKALVNMNQEDGFRCPSCARPFPKILLLLRNIAKMAPKPWRMRLRLKW